MGFIWKAKQGLSKHGILKTKFGLKLGEPVEKKEGEKKRKRKRRWRSQDQANKVWKLTLIMDSKRLCMNCHAWLVSSLSPNLEFC